MGLLAFFLDPTKKEHGLGDLMIRSLLEAAKSELVSHDFGSVTNVDTEVATENRKRLDIVIDAPEFVLGIENKLFASAECNPFEDYSQHLAAMGRETAEGILLCLKEEKPETDLHGFRVVTYDDFFSALEPSLGKRLAEADQRYLAYLIDFITTIRNLKAAKPMDIHLQKFLSEQGHEQTSVEFYLRMKQFAWDLRVKTKEVAKTMEVPLCFKGPFYWNSLLDAEPGSETELYDVVYCEARMWGGTKLRFEASVGLSRGWQIEPLNQTDRSRNGILQAWLKSKGMSCSEEGICAKFAFDVGYPQVVAEYKRLMETIAVGLAYREVISDLVRESPDRMLDDCEGVHSRFALKEWDEFPELRSSRDWTTSHRTLLFEFKRGFDCLSLSLIFGPGADADGLRKRLIKLASGNERLFRGCEAKLLDDYTVLYRSEFLPKQILLELDERACTRELKKRWKSFVEDELPLLRKAISDALRSR